MESMGGFMKPNAALAVSKGKQLFSYTDSKTAKFLNSYKVTLHSAGNCHITHPLLQDTQTEHLDQDWRITISWL